MKEKKMTVAIDLCRDYSQICYYTEGMQEGVSVSVIPGEERFLVPMVIAKRYQWDEWYIGEVALQYLQKEEAVGVYDLMDLVGRKQAVELEGKTYQALELLQYYLEKLLQYLPVKIEGEWLQTLVITLQHQTQELINDLHHVCRVLNIKQEQVTIIGHAESFIYYTLFQKKELWTNDVIVFNFTKYAFTMKRLSMIRTNRAPVQTIVKEQDYSDKLQFSLLETAEGKTEADRTFAEIVEAVSAGQFISTIYLTGCGFYENWLDTALTALCNKHRVFQGYNLFVKGGIYAAMHKAGKGNCDNYQFICTGRTLVDISLEVLQDTENVYLTLSNAGKNWYEAGARLECLLEHTKQVKLRITSALTKESQDELISLESFPDRPLRTTRIELTLAYENDQTCILYIKDKGFGDFYPATDTFVRKEINIQRYIL